MRIRQSLWSSLLRSEIKKIIPSPLRLRARAYVLIAATLLLLLSARSTGFAGSATWRLNPTDSNWNNATNWTPETVPNGPTDTATFDVSNTTEVSISAATEVAGIVFNAGASPFTITAEPVTLPATTLTISGAGITNNSGITQNFVAAGAVDGTADAGGILFTNAATAGSLTAFMTNGAAVSGGLGGAMVFTADSTAGNGTFTNNGAAVSGAEGGVMIFTGTSTAGNAMLIANGGLGGGAGGSIRFLKLSRATRQRSGRGTVSVEVFGNGNLDISGHESGVVLRSIEGNGNIFLGAGKLRLGTHNNTLFSGVIQDGGVSGGVGGSLTKVISGTLTLTGANTYTGGTTILGGHLLVNNKPGSGTGSGPVLVWGGYNRIVGGTKLGGTGIIAGAVTVTNSGFAPPHTSLSPGISGAGTLTIQSTLTIAGSFGNVIYNFDLNSRTARADRVVANGVTISDAQFSFSGLGKALMPGTVYTVIDNTAATPIAGTFNNLVDGSIFTVNGYNFQANYEGGDGNDLTLTVLP